MFPLPSIWNLVVSTIVFFIAVWYIRRYLDEQELPKGTTRGMLVFAFASLISWGSGTAVDWALEKLQRPQAAIRTSGNLSQPPKTIGQTQP